MCLTQDRVKIVGVKEWGENAEGEGPMRDRMSRRGRVIAPHQHPNNRNTWPFYVPRAKNREGFSRVVENHTSVTTTFLSGKSG